MNLKSSKKDIKANRGITLIALVITMIVLLILAGVTIATLTGDNGLLTKAGDARNTSEKAGEKERIQMEVAGAYDTRGRLDATKIVENIEKNIGATAEATSNSFPVKVTYNNGHKYQVASDGSIMISVNAGDTAPSDSNAVYSSGDFTAIIPAGFTVSDVEGEKEIETGLVIRDDLGNEFVWIPVGIPWKSDSSRTIMLGRYVFDSNGNIDETLSKVNPQDQIKQSLSSSTYYTEGLKNSTTNNTHAKDIEDFLTKTNTAGGFWIGRYEARTTSKTSRTSNNDTLTSVTEKPENSIYNYILQADAAAKAREMYNTNNYFESDLINSYAWDTATLFLQEYDNRIYNIDTNSNYKGKYSKQTRLSEGLKGTGTNASTVAESNKDKICNVYDMADNCWEWSTETCSNSLYLGVQRGGCSDFSDSGVCQRCYDLVNTTSRLTFRPILYVK